MISLASRRCIAGSAARSAAARHAPRIELLAGGHGAAACRLVLMLLVKLLQSSGFVGNRAEHGRMMPWMQCLSGMQVHDEL